MLKQYLSDSGTAIMGSALASGENRAKDAITKALDSPLLNDNKITGAKNVLLLIVSGSHEITIDEIGEINDHIQNEAGHGANIIMGVGEDETLEESIAVTIIATGFNVEQQDEISNTETKKVIHSLISEDLDLSPKEKEPVIIAPIIELKEKKETPIVKHTLDIENDEQDFFRNEASVFSEKVSKPVANVDLIPTSELIRKIKVVYEEVKAKVKEDDDFIIKPVTRMSKADKDISDIEVVSDYIEEEQQITLTFDLPLSSNSKLEKEDDFLSFDMDEKVKKITVNDYVELIPVNETSEAGDIRYALEDYIEVESSMNKKQKEAMELIEEFDQEIVFEKKVVKASVTESIKDEDIDPLNSPISEMLKERAEERRRKMKDFNYKFNNAKIDDIEKVPAYKRQGINLDEAKHSSETDMSRSSIGIDDNDDIQIRSNNSFLHDNVD